MFSELQLREVVRGVVEKVIQFFILVLSALAIVFTQVESQDLNSLAPYIGLLAQPLWFYESYSKKQWGIFILTIFITISWSIGII